MRRLWANFKHWLRMLSWKKPAVQAKDYWKARDLKRAWRPHFQDIDRIINRTQEAEKRNRLLVMRRIMFQQRLRGNMPDGA